MPERSVRLVTNTTPLISIGVLLKAQQLGYPLDMASAIRNMQSQGIWLSEKVIAFALSNNHKVNTAP